MFYRVERIPRVGIRFICLNTKAPANDNLIRKNLKTRKRLSRAKAAILLAT